MAESPACRSFALFYLTCVCDISASLLELGEISDVVRSDSDPECVLLGVEIPVICQILGHTFRVRSQWHQGRKITGLAHGINAILTHTMVCQDVSGVSRYVL